MRVTITPSSSLVIDNICVCQTAKYVRESYDALVDIFECIENFARRLKIYTEIRPTPAMTEMMVKIMVELLVVLALATKQINQGRLSELWHHFWLSLVLDGLQRNMQESYWGRRVSNQFFSDLID